MLRPVDVRKRNEARLRKKGEVRSAEIVRATRLSRTHVNRIFQQMLREGVLRLIGKANRTRYVPAEPKRIRKARAAELSFNSVLRNRNLQEDLEKFRRIILDFSNVTMVGQGFADEVFRVWHARHPETTIEVAGADENARFMIARAKSGKTDGH